MTALQLQAMGIFSAMALVAAAVMILGIAGALHLEKDHGRRLLLLVVPALVLGTAISAALSGRDLTYASLSVTTLGGGIGGSRQLLRGLSLLLVLLGVAVIVSRLFARLPATSAAGGRGLFLSFCLFYGCNEFVNAALGTVPTFSHNSLYTLLVFGAVYSRRHDPLPAFIDAAKLALLLLMLGSLALAIAVPALALQPDYKGWLPAVNVRLWGLGSNPNSLGPLAVLLLLLEAMQPSRRRPSSLLVVLAATGVLLLCQSKTAWGAALVAAVVLVAFHGARNAQGRVRPGFVIGAVLALALIPLTLLVVDLPQLIDALSREQVGDDVSTLTGRGRIWAAALRTWEGNLWFGYGPLAWDVLHRIEMGLPSAYSAHNQFLQALSSAGLLGLLSMLAFMVMLAAAAWRSSASTRGVSLALVCLLVVRCVTETPLAVGSLFLGETITLLVLFRLCLGDGRVRSAQPAMGAQPARPLSRVHV